MKIERDSGCRECGIDDGDKVQFDMGGLCPAIICRSCLRRALRMLKRSPKGKTPNKELGGKKEGNL